MEPTSLSLLEQLRTPGRADAWARFVHLYTPLLTRWADRLGVPPADRGDLLQEVFLAFYRALPAFHYQPGRSFRAWVYTVAANKWREMRRKRVPVPLAGDDPRWLAPHGEDPAAQVSEAEYRAVLAAQAAKLIRDRFADVTWRAFWATAVDGRPAVDVAAELGLTANAVYLARARVLACLRAELAGMLD
ncbi:MAG TPA: sigma-70 family RNA polymerase sigma factor [Gemmataceae bacterium]|jgi:RNA polymerase sigma-70 factor (ECF subfamily)